MVKLMNVTKEYPNGTVAVKEADLKIDKGEFVFIVGASGSGKSTLLKLLMREENPTEGEIVVNGKVVSELSDKAIPYFRRNIGIVFQDFRLLDNKTVYENISFALRVIEAPLKVIRRQVPMCLSLVGLAKKANVYPEELSGGEQQRVALARAMVNNPVLLIADEPTGNLDPETSMEIMRLLVEINQRGTTVIVATHERGIVSELNKRVVTIDKGVIVKDMRRESYLDED